MLAFLRSSHHFLQLLTCLSNVFQNSSFETPLNSFHLLCIALLLWRCLEFPASSLLILWYIVCQILWWILVTLGIFCPQRPATFLDLPCSLELPLETYLQFSRIKWSLFILRSRVCTLLFSFIASMRRLNSTVLWQLQKSLPLIAISPMSSSFLVNSRSSCTSPQLFHLVSEAKYYPHPSKTSTAPILPFSPFSSWQGV